MIGFDIRKRIEKNIKKAAEEFTAREDITTEFGDPLIGYVDTTHPLFDMFFTKGLSNHPKQIYRPGNTVVLHYIPYPEEAIQSNKTEGAPSEAWSKAFVESMWLSMKLNGVVRDTLNEVGRLSSCTNTPADWDEKVCHESWSHKMAAYAAGMGDFGPAGSFRTENGGAGRLSAIITDGKYASAFEMMDNEQLDAAYRRIMSQSCFKGAEGVSCSDDMIKACPCGAVAADGIDRIKCQEYCKTIDDCIPSPDVCGKCFRF